MIDSTPAERAHACRRLAERLLERRVSPGHWEGHLASSALSTGTAVLHCPSANLKLGSGIAPIHDYRGRGIPVALGADGAPCNNRLSMLAELRQAALLQAAVAGPGAWPAAEAL